MTKSEQVEQRAQPKQARARFTVDAILEAGERLLARGERPSTRTIARLAGVSVGTLYQYFPRRDAIIAKIVDRRLKHDEERLLEVFARHRDASLEDLVHEVLDGLLPRSEWELALYPPMVDHLQGVERHREVQEFIRRFEALWAAELARRQPMLRPGLDPAVAALTSIHAIRGAMLALARREPPPPRSQVLEVLVDLGTAYLMGPPRV